MPSSVNTSRTSLANFSPSPACFDSTLTVGATDGRRKHLLFQQGLLADMDTGREDTLLEAAVLDTGS